MVAAVLGATLALACGVREPITGPTVEQNENLGVALVGTHDVTLKSALLWSEDGSTLLYEVGQGTVELRATDVVTGATRTLGGPREDYTDPVLSNGSGGVFYSTDRVNGRRSTYHVSLGGASTVLLTDRAPGTDFANPADGALVLPAPDGSLAAYIVYPDSLFLYDPVAGVRRFVTTKCVRAIAFSPDQSELLCRRDALGDDGWSTVSLTDGSGGTVRVTPAEIARVQIVRWDEDAMRTLYWTNSRFRVWTIGSGTARTLWQPGPGAGLRVIDYLNYSWSADGTRFAFWSHECLDINRLGVCERGQSLLHVVDMESNTGTTVAVAKGPRGGEQIALSPDGRRVAFVFNQKIWLQVVD